MSEFKEIFTGEIISITGGLIGGTLLSTLENKLLLIPGLLILIPGFLEMRGNISGSLASRLSSALHLGKIEPRIKKERFVLENVAAAFFLALIVGFVLGVISMIGVYIIFKVVYFPIIYVGIIAAIISNLIEIPSTVFTTFWLFRKGYDPDNIMGPYVTTTGDIISLLALLIAVLVV